MRNYKFPPIRARFVQLSHEVSVLRSQNHIGPGIVSVVSKNANHE